MAEFHLTGGSVSCSVSLYLVVIPVTLVLEQKHLKFLAGTPVLFLLQLTKPAVKTDLCGYKLSLISHHNLLHMVSPAAALACQLRF